MPTLPERSLPDDTTDDLPKGVLRVLIVDDNPDICQILVTALEALGSYNVQTAGDAKTALAALDREEEPFHGIFLDIQMPGTTGIELCAIIRNTPGYGDVPVIMLTAMSERQYLQAAISKGANDFLTKPFDLDEIRKRFSVERTNRRRREHLKGNLAVDSSETRMRTTEVIRALEDAIALSGLERCVKREAFETYLLLSAKRFSEPSLVRAVKIAGVYDLFSRLPTGAYQGIVQEVAAIISRLSERSGDMIAHYGNGIFLSASAEKSALDPGAVSEALERSNYLPVLAEHRLSLHVIVGREISLEATSSADVLLTLNKAIRLAEQVEDTNFGWSNYREWQSRKRSMGQAQSRIETSAYEKILDDFIKEGQLGWG